MYFRYNVQNDQLIVSLSLGKIAIEPFYSMCVYVIAPNVGSPVTNPMCLCTQYMSWSFGVVDEGSAALPCSGSGLW